MFKDIVLTNDKSHNVLNILKCAVKGYIFSIIILAVFAVIITYTPLSENYIGLISILASASGALLASILAGKIYKSKGLIIGIITACIYFLIILLTGVLIFENNVQMSQVFKKLLWYITAGLLGGVIGVNIKTKN